MFSHATKHSLRVRSSSMAVVLAAIIALAAFLALPSGHARALSHAAARQANPSSPHTSVGITSGVGTIVYQNNQYVFVIGGYGDNRLWADHWDGSTWQWLYLGAPNGVSFTVGVGAVVYQNNFCVFLLDNNGELWEYLWTPYTQQFVPLDSLPYPNRLVGGEGVTVYNNTLYAFVSDSNGELWQYYCWNCSSTLHRQPRGWPSGSVGVYGAGTIGTVVYTNNLYVFVPGTDGHVWVDLWDGHTWQWADNGYPANGVFSGAGAVSYGPYLDVFVVNNDRHLWGEYWDSYTWVWDDPGTPPGTTVREGAGAVRAGQYLYVYVVGNDGQIWATWRRDGSTSWTWFPQGSPG